MNNYYTTIIQKLNNGEIITHKGKGNSMLPLIKSDQLVKIQKVDLSEINSGDIVLCRVKGKIYTHLVTAVRDTEKKREFQISNNRGFVNGWTSIIYGKIVEILPMDHNEKFQAAKKLTELDDNLGIGLK